MRVLLTGASGALGTAVIAHFGAQGTEVIGVSRDAHGMLNGDLTKPEDCARIAAEAGEVDAVIHAMGAFTMGCDNAAWQYMLNVNLISAFQIFNAFLPGMKRRRSGALVAVGTRAAVEPAAGIAAYAASKAALVHYVRTLALELRDTGVRANIILPSTIDTAANRGAMPDTDFSKWVTPESVAKVLAWLVSEGSCDVSGAMIPVYGKA